jgi:predicted membrane-bound mannosyltransferase
VKPPASNEEFLTDPFRSPWRCALMLGLIALLCFTRLWDLGSKTMMHDELLFVQYTYRDLYERWTYSYLPILHGPIKLHFQNLVFHVFGVSDYTARLGAALLGIGTFFLLWQFRFWLREPGTWFVLTFYALSPGITFFQRFFHQDAMYMFCTVWILASLVSWWRTRSGWWAASALLAITSLFTNKASALFVYFSVLTFVVLLVIHDVVAYFLQGKSRDIPDYLQRIPKPPSAWWPALALSAFATLCVTQIFEGIRYDLDVRRAIGHDWILRDVRSIPLALGWFSIADDAAPDAKGLNRGEFWRLFYVGLLVGSLLLFAAIRLFIVQRIGHREFLTSLWRRVHAARFHLAGALFLSVFWYLYIYTMAFEHRLGFFEIYAKTWSYWGGQHEQGRIAGPFHQHTLNLLIYELPAVLMILGAWVWGLFRLRPTASTGVSLILVAVGVAVFHKLIFSGLELDLPGRGVVPAGIDWLRNIVLATAGMGALLLLIPSAARVVLPAGLVAMIGYSIAWLTSSTWQTAFRAPAYRHGEPITLTGRHVTFHDFIEISFNFDGGWNILMVIILIFLATILAWHAIGEGRRFHAFLIWYFVTMFGSAAYAREAVPQVGIHVMLPAILLAGSYLSRLWELRPELPAARLLIWPALGVFVLWNAKATFNLNFHNSDKAVERMAYGPANRDVREHMNFIRSYHRIAGARVEDGIPVWARRPNDVQRHKQVRVYIKQLDQVTWPAKWYLRDIEYSEGQMPEKAIEEGWEFIFLAVGDEERYPDLAERYHIHRGRGTTFWTPSPISMESLANIWKEAIPGHYLDGTPAASQAFDSKAEWRRIRRYLTHREFFDGTGRGFPSVSAFEYLFCYRKDLL